ncbi:hypothetical protein [Sorangium sp. So ce1024]|uniref:hypothetical protein n=1 Tax=unclassified Sorangium TaxID=2621164 RepID=UPI003EFE208A
MTHWMPVATLSLGQSLAQTWFDVDVGPGVQKSRNLERDELLSQRVAKLPLAHVGETMVLHPVIPQLPDDHSVQPDTVAACVASPSSSVPSGSSPSDISIAQLALARATHARSAVAKDRVRMFFFLSLLWV